MNRSGLGICLLGIAACFIFLLAACSTEQPSPARIGSNTWPGYEPLYLARELGYLDADKVRLVEHTSATQVLRAFRNGLLDAAALTLDEALMLTPSGYEFDVVLVMDISHGGDVIISQPRFTDMRSLKGKKIGVESTALGAYVITRALELENMTLSDVEIVPVELSEHEKAFHNKQVDAIVTFEPAKTRLLAKDGKLIFDSTRIPGEIVDVLIVQKNYMQSHRDVVKSIVEQWFRALEYMKNHKNDAATRIAKRLNLKPGEVFASFSGLKFPSRKEVKAMLVGTQNQPASLPKTADRLVEVLYDKKLVTRLFDSRSIFSGATELY